MVPDELRERPQWLAWKYRTRGGKRTKVPISPHGGLGKSNDPATWATYRQSLAVLDADGLGYVFSPDDPFCGLDIDGCFLTSGALHPAAWDVLRRLNGYVETSPSGYGLHVIVRGRLARNRKLDPAPWGAELSFWDHGKFFTMTGDGRGSITEAQAALNYLVSYYLPEPDDKPPVASRKPLSDDDSAIVGKVLSDPRMAALWRGETGEHGEDHSAADLALLAHLAFYTGGDRMRMDSLFRRSGLYRDKWERQDYRERTLDKALQGA